MTRLSEEALTARLKTVRAAITHAGEKGSALEAAASKVVRDILPAEYGVGRGFVAHRTATSTKVELSPQFDLVIYDALRGGPLVRLGGCEVYPIEAVYGYIEVKASLQLRGNATEVKSETLEYCVDLKPEGPHVYYAALSYAATRE